MTDCEPVCTLNYANHFWGEKHMGYQVLYQNMRANQSGLKDFVEFIKERTQLEEEYAKHAAKILHKVGQMCHASQTAQSSMLDTWSMTKNTLERVGQAQSRLVQSLHDLGKEAHQYGDELSKQQRKLKEQATIDAVNLMQTTTTCLQKSKETYTSRCHDLEKVRQENVSTKEIGKAIAKAAKAKEEYKMNVEKYATVRENFIAKIRDSSNKFQKHDECHLHQMIKFFVAYAKRAEDNFALSAQVYGEFREAIENLDSVEMLAHFVKSKGTGDHEPEVIQFEEPDMTQLVGETEKNGEQQQHQQQRESNGLSLQIDEHRTTTLGVGVGVGANLISLSPLSEMPPPTPPPAAPDVGNRPVALDVAPLATGELLETESEAPTATLDEEVTQTPAVQQQHSRSKLSALLLPGRKLKTISQSSSNLAPTPTSTTVGSKELGPQSQLKEGSPTEGAGGFLKRRDKKKGKKKGDEATKTAERHARLDEIGSNASSKSDERPTVEAEVDDEGFMVRPEQSFEKYRPSSSSEDDSDVENDVLQKKRLKKIAIRDESKATASTDELAKVVGSMTLAESLLNRGVHKSRTFDMSPGVSEGRDPWGAPAAPNANANTTLAYLRPALTGDDHLSKSFAAFAAETQGGLKPSLTGATSRARPRPLQQTPMFSIPGGRKASGSFETVPFPSAGQTSSTSRSDSLSSIQSASSNQSQQGGTGSGSASFDTVPVAMALTETAHAWFVGQDHSRTKVRVFGSVAVSFPSSVVPLLASQDQSNRPTPLTFCLLKAGKIHALIPNKQVLSTDAVSQFHSSESHRFTFDLEGLSTYLKKEAEKRPSSPFYNVEVLRYEVRQPQAPLILTSFWKCEAHNTDLRIDYKLNSAAAAADHGDYSKPCATLLNLHYSTKVDGSVANVVSKPEAEWSKAEELLSWKLTELSKHGESSGSLKARLTVDKGPSQTAPTYVQFLVQDSTMSGASLEVETNTYRLSLLKRKVLSGKYLCEPERR